MAGRRRVNKLLRTSIGRRLLDEVSWGLDTIKEISESLAVWDVALAVARARGWSVSGPTIRVIVPADGRYPRTGALIALSSAWSVTSVDPLLRVNGPHPRVPRLTCVRGKLEDLPELRADLVISVHGHEPPAATRRAASGGGHVVAMPCCYPWPAGTGTEQRVAGACLAPDRTIYIERVLETF